jgi:hypothetical protein
LASPADRAITCGLAGALQIIELDEAFADAAPNASVPWLRSSIRLLSPEMLDQRPRSSRSTATPS